MRPFNNSWTFSGAPLYSTRMLAPVDNIPGFMSACFVSGVHRVHVHISALYLLVGRYMYIYAYSRVGKLTTQTAQDAYNPEIQRGVVRYMYINSRFEIGLRLFLSLSSLLPVQRVQEAQAHLIGLRTPVSLFAGARCMVSDLKIWVENQESRSSVVLKN